MSSAAAAAMSTASYVNFSSLLALGVGFMDVTIVLLILRVVTNRMTRRHAQVDDIAVVIASFFTVAICINLITATAYRVFGRSLPVTLEKVKTKQQLNMAIYSPQLQQNAQFFYVGQLLFVFQMTFARLSIVWFYRRTLVPEPLGLLHKATLALTGVLGVWLVGFFFAYAFQCGSNFKYIWQGPAVAQATQCVSTTGLDLTASGTGVLLDLIIVFLPMQKIYSLRLPTAKKIQVSSAFMVGLLSVVGGTVRLAAVSSVALGAQNVFTSMDPAMLQSTMAYWQVFEVGFAMMAASLPGLRPLVNRVAGGVGSGFFSLIRSNKDKSTRSGSSASLVSNGEIVKTNTVDVEKA